MRCGNAQSKLDNKRYKYDMQKMAVRGAATGARSVLSLLEPQTLGIADEWAHHAENTEAFQRQR